MNHEQAIELVSQARAALEKARTWNDYSTLRTMADMAAVLLRKRDDCKAAYLHANEIKMRCEVEMGRHLIENPIRVGGPHLPYSDLSNLGIDRLEASLFRQMASVPEMELERVIADHNARDKAIARSTIKELGVRERIRKDKIARDKAQVIAGTKADDTCRVWSGDAVELCSALEPGTIDLLCTDPPYGIDVHRTRQGGQDYADGEDYALPLFDAVLGALAPALKPDAHAYVCAGYSHVEAFRGMLEKHGWDVQPWPLVWIKDNHTMCAFAQWYPCQYEFVLFARRTKARMFDKLGSSVLEYGRNANRVHHSAAKPVDMLQHLIERSTVPGNTVLDPFAGSGSTIAAAKACGRAGIGFEINPEMAELANGLI